MTEFKREPRYVVFKIKDIEAYCTSRAEAILNLLSNVIACGRAADGKPPFNAVVVEQDWPEFEPVWKMIEERMTQESGRELEEKS
jgi:hypothetical protein